MDNLHEIALAVWEMGKSIHDYSYDDEKAAVGFELMYVAKKILSIEIQLAKLEKIKDGGDFNDA